MPAGEAANGRGQLPRHYAVDRGWLNRRYGRASRIRHAAGIPVTASRGGQFGALLFGQTQRLG
jgi:hypothetical protein